MKLIPQPTIFKQESPQGRDHKTVSTLYSDSGTSWVTFCLHSPCPEGTWGLQPPLLFGLQSHYFDPDSSPSYAVKVPHLSNYFMFPRNHEKTPQPISSKMTPPWSMTSPAPPPKEKQKQGPSELRWRSSKESEEWRRWKIHEERFLPLGETQHKTTYEQGWIWGCLINSWLNFQMWEISCPSHLGKYQPRQSIIFLWTEMYYLLEKPVVEAERNILHRSEDPAIRGTKSRIKRVVHPWRGRRKFIQIASDPWRTHSTDSQFE